jgi:RNA polymerase sigma-70 factor (ECF subfamily)
VARSVERDPSRLIEDYLRGDLAALEVVDGWIAAALREYSSAIQGATEDLIQEARTRIFDNLSRGVFNGRSSLRTYVHRITKNVCIDHYRRERRRRTRDRLGEITSSSSCAGEGMAALMARDLLEKILADLSDEDALMIRLVFSEHWSYSEVARRLGVSEGTVKSRMSRCRDRLLSQRRKLLRKGRVSP